jgi:transcriptional regulator with XRE-family HTH domain
MDKDISTQLREVKDATGWTETHLALELGTTQPTVNRILNGQAECKIATYNAIAKLHVEKCRHSERRSHVQS